METNLKEFEKHYLAEFKNLADMIKKKKELEENEKKLKAKLEEAMILYDVKSIDNEFVKVTRVNGSSIVKIDLKKLEEKENGLYQDLLEDYGKETVKAPYLTFTVK